MSGFVGIVNLDGAPVDRPLLSRMTNFLESRGPDGKELWIAGRAGFGHTLLRTTDEAEGERQPFTMDGRIRIVADARIDARHDLVSKLKNNGFDVSLDRPDVELILSAYHAWGECCVDHLLGDFAFGIWDPARSRLLCARDHMGIKPLYYAQGGGTVVFSNSLDCLRLHPRVSSRLDDRAVGDFLLFDFNRTKDTTYFAEIRRVPPAHAATWTDAGLRLNQYWTLPVDEPIRYRRLEDYTDRFQELVREAVKDRLRIRRVAVFMSGGLDSPTLAATARDLLRERSGGQIRAFTTVYDGIDHERHYAGLVAKRLEIPIWFRDGNAELTNPDWEQGFIHRAEPVSNPLLLEQKRAFYQKIAFHHRVALYGEGPDAALWYEWRPYLRFLAAKKEFAGLLYESVRHMLLHRRFPLMQALPRRARQRKLNKTWSNGYPPWLNQDFESRLDLRRRWTEDHRSALPVHAIRPVGYRALQGSEWQVLFEGLDPSNTEAAFEVRHPYFDIRLLRFLLAVPAVPWCRVKYLLRRSMRGVLPDPVLRRPKAPLDRDPWAEFTRRSGFRPLVPTDGLSDYVNPRLVPTGAPATPGDFREGLCPRSLNFWLKNLNVCQQNYRGDLTCSIERR